MAPCLAGSPGRLEAALAAGAASGQRPFLPQDRVRTEAQGIAFPGCCFLLPAITHTAGKRPGFGFESRPPRRPPDTPLGFLPSLPRRVQTSEAGPPASYPHGAGFSPRAPFPLCSRETPTFHSWLLPAAPPRLIPGTPFLLWCTWPGPARHPSRLAQLGGSPSPPNLSWTAPRRQRLKKRSRFCWLQVTGTHTEQAKQERGSL